MSQLASPLAGQRRQAPERSLAGTHLRASRPSKRSAKPIPIREFWPIYMWRLPLVVIGFVSQITILLAIMAAYFAMRWIKAMHSV